MPDNRFPDLMSELDPREHARKTKNVAAGYALSNVMKAEPFVDSTNS